MQFIPWIGIGLWLVSIAVVVSDAPEKKQSPVVWGIVTFLFPGLGLLLYALITGSGKAWGMLGLIIALNLGMYLYLSDSIDTRLWSRPVSTSEQMDEWKPSDSTGNSQEHITQLFLQKRDSIESTLIGSPATDILTANWDSTGNFQYQHFSGGQGWIGVLALNPEKRAVYY